jgi:hypothetical protein
MTESIQRAFSSTLKVILNGSEEVEEVVRGNIQSSNKGKESGNFHGCGEKILTISTAKNL